MNSNFVEPIAEDYKIIYQHTDQNRTDGPTLVRMPSGRLVSSFVIFVINHNDLNKKGADTCVKTSDDNGETWVERKRMPYELGLMFEHNGIIYLIGSEAGRGDLVITSSPDDGVSWHEPKVIFKGKFWNTSTGKVILNNKLYWCIGAPNEAGEWNTKDSRTAVISADLDMDILSPSAWRISEYLTYPGTPETLRKGLHGTPEAPYYDHWLEGNVAPAEDPGHMRVYWRIRIDGQTTPGICAVCDLHDDGEKLCYEFTQFYPLPGAQNHFHIIKDPESGMYWMTSNLPTHSQNKEFNARIYGGERRIMMLYFSFDGLDWLPASYLAIWPKLRQSSNYSTPLIDGNDLLIASRTSYKGLTPHDNDRVTLHTVKDFRKLTERLTNVEY